MDREPYERDHDGHDDGYDPDAPEYDDRVDDDQPSGPARGVAEYGAHPARPVEGHGRDVEPSWRSRVRRTRRNMPLWQELPLLLVVAFCLAVLVRTFLVQAFYIPSGSMEDTLLVGDRVLVNKIVYDVRQPARGEIVVFNGTDNWTPENGTDPNVGFFSKLGRTIGDLVGISQPSEKDFIKRVVGLPGDVVACCDVNGKVTVNGYPLDETYLTDDSPLDAPPNPRDCRSRRFGPITVEPGQMFVMGDHRIVSQDSRCQGQVPIDHVIGRAFVVVWPSSHWTGLAVPGTFSKVPKPFAAPAGPAYRNPAGPASPTPVRWADPAPGAYPVAVAGPADGGVAGGLLIGPVAILTTLARSARTLRARRSTLRG